MSEYIVVAINVGVANGPTMVINRALAVDAYDKFDVIVPDGSTALTVELQPGGSGQVGFLLVSSDQYGNNLTYKVNDAADAYKLDGPHLLIGAGAVSLLDEAPAKLVFANSLGMNAQVRILIGRDATL